MKSYLSKKNKEIGVLGLWHLGCVYSASLARLGFEVSAFDFNTKIIEDLKNGTPPIKEPLLDETINEYQNKKLFFTTIPDEAIRNKKYIFVTFDVPVDNNDRIDLSLIDKTFTQIKKYISPKTTIVVSSQLPVGYCGKWIKKIREKEPAVNIIYFPENLRLGTAFESFFKPDRVIIGSDNEKILDQFEKDFSTLNCPFIKTGLESAEMTKHALNSYLATMISFSSEISDVCELFGANMDEVVRALKSEKRVSPYAPLSPGIGFAGGTLGRDIQTLKKITKDKKYKPLLLNAVYQVNKNRLPYVLKKTKTVLPSLKNKKIGILGLTYKPQTNTLRRSMSLELANLLKKEGAAVSALDPMIKKEIKDFEFIKIQKSEMDFFHNLDAIILMTEWPEFRTMNWTSLGSQMKNKYIIDTKNFLDTKTLSGSGYKFLRVGVS